MTLPSPPPSPSENNDSDNDNGYCDCDYSIDVRTTLGKRYSVERYYMLSEIEQNSLDPVYLNDYDNKNNDKSNTINFPPFVVLYLTWNPANLYDNSNDSSNIDRTESVFSFQKGPIRGAIRKLKSLLVASESAGARTSSTCTDTRTKATSTAALSLSPSPSSPRVYVVIDMLVDAKNNNSDDDESTNTNTRREEYQKLVPIAEQLASSILLDGNVNDDNDGVGNDNTTSRLSSSGMDLAGVTVGLTDHPRAAPGLESCLEAISIGSRDRRKYGNIANNNNDNKKSCVGIVCNSVQDLVGFDEEGETDAVQDVMQSRTDAFIAWQKNANANANTNANTKHQKSGVAGEPTTDDTNDKGKGKTAAAAISSPLTNFAHEAHRYWRVHKAGLSPEPTPEENRLLDAELGHPPNDNGTGNTSSTMLIIAMVFAVASFFWKR
uniref:Uncharacterized protein n=1 Tax=Pseudo-nitzschia australis TaxID=44445 RepID=A0A7S4EGZ0_9STRA|mmetsp:Transcript_28007/g.61705  ORF Transcript_28007/g.61705 Transcript_28007/m.61705 type:complete len:436 (+) Transcript_28007:151-1458(+)